MSALGLRIGRLRPETTALFICDVQERFRAIINRMPQVIHTSRLMVRGAQALNMPVITTEQYPKALGKTVTEISEHFAGSSSSSVFEKNHFSMIVPEVKTALDSYKAKSPIKSVLIAGVETHVCVLQTALDLLEDGYDVHVLCDGVSSQDPFDRKYALKRLEQSGAFLTTSESALFQLLNNSHHPQFKLISNLVKEHKAEIRKTPEGILE
eukprot:TRINITY_DN5701_c0_g1_i6.p1 TRINITY_DN5701_c0_g1~~TRINITY_DN5701_c0_g1_i6.p1  ORF type:complete len:225 (+),score=40.23 TRINITY_DN5701_c0_g1_i6:48-677(+)